MANISAFKSMIPVEEKVYEVSSKPYESLSKEQLRKELEENPVSFINVVRPNINAEKNFEDEDDLVYDQARFNLNRLKNEGVFQEVKEPSMFIYEQIIEGKPRTCLLACSHVDDYKAELIKRHEMTLPKKEEKIINYTRRMEIQPAPVFLTYPSVDDLDQFISEFKANNKSVYSFVSSSGNQHNVWRLSDVESIESIKSIFEEQVDSLYIADGHHRASSAYKWAKLRASVNPNHTGEEGYNYLFCAYWPSSQIEIIDYNRVVKDLNGLSVESLLQRIGTFFHVSEEKSGYKPSSYNEIGMYVDGRDYCLKPIVGSFNEASLIASLDVSILQENILDPILGINDPRKDKRIDFISGRKGVEYLKKQVDNGGFSIAFSLFPVTMDQFFAIADSNGIMPPKSTWFEPKLRTGVVVRMMD